MEHLLEKARRYVRMTENWSAAEVDNWYEANVGYRLSEDDTGASLQELRSMAAEMACLHENNEGDVHYALCAILHGVKVSLGDEAIVVKAIPIAETWLVGFCDPETKEALETVEYETANFDLESLAEDFLKDKASRLETYFNQSGRG